MTNISPNLYGTNDELVLKRKCLFCLCLGDLVAKLDLDLKPPNLDPEFLSLEQKLIDLWLNHELGMTFTVLKDLKNYVTTDKNDKKVKF